MSNRTLSKTTHAPFLLPLLVGALCFGIWFAVSEPEQQELHEPLAPRANNEVGVEISAPAPTHGADPDRPDRTPLSRANLVPSHEQTDADNSARLEAGFTFVDGRAYWDGVPLAETRIEDWRLEELKGLLKVVRAQQSQTLRAAVDSELLEHHFLPAGEFSSKKLWFSDEVHYGVQRPSIGADGELVMESGHVRIPKNHSPEAYVLRDLVRRIYTTPTYAEKLLTEGLAYERDVVRSKHPNAVVEITPDLAVWTFYGQSGEIVGQFYNTVNANN